MYLNLPVVSEAGFNVEVNIRKNVFYKSFPIIYEIRNLKISNLIGKDSYCMTIFLEFVFPIILRVLSALVALRT